MSARRRKKRRRREESAQVELLPDVAEAEPAEAGAAPAEALAEPAEARAEHGVSDEPESGTPVTPSLSSGGATAAEVPAAERPPDRWAKAVGRSPPARPSGVQAPPTGELHKVARDHASADVRPAGQPLTRAKELVERGRVQEAIELYMGILTVNPSNLKAHNNLGVLLDELKQYEAALEHFEAAERIASENVEVLTNYASTLTSLARYDEAEDLLRRAQRIAPEDVHVRRAVGVLHFRRGLYGQAEVELRSVCGKDPKNGLAFYYRGEALNRLGRFDEALRAMAEAVSLMPQDPRAYYTLGHLYDRRNMPAEAAEMYRRARQLQAR